MAIGRLGGANLISQDYNALVNAQTGTTYTMQASDNGKLVTFDNAGTVTVTLPSGLPAGFNIVCVQLGAGQVSFVAGSGATISNRQNQAKVVGQKGVVTVVAVATSTYYIAGDTGA